MSVCKMRKKKAGNPTTSFLPLNVNSSQCNETRKHRESGGGVGEVERKTVFYFQMINFSMCNSPDRYKK